MDSTSGGSRADDESRASGTESTESNAAATETTSSEETPDDSRSGSGGGSGPEYETNFRDHPDCYSVGRGEEGVFKVQPYKGELLALWSYADRATADESGDAIYGRFLDYRDAGDFVGMDMARKYLQMGYTRSMRYARYPGGKKYDDDGKERDAQHWADDDKREAALVYEAWWSKAEADETYAERKKEHREKHG
ncbi:DUF4385 domain-containing protein [Haloprofundus salinisoli]|uniref:DUF4385 domain-containing protein n=1 Tax=Haloprofundus salinisoli TaxID=2876193 RepID=UPI001CCD0270|nr:DUF4385 domain-containing protein [Haloprofundus salinisoli]